MKMEFRLVPDMMTILYHWNSVLFVGKVKMWRRRAQERERKSLLLFIEQK